MQQGNVLVIGVGSSANDGTGDPLRTAFQKINSNFAGIYSNGQFLANITSSSARPNYSWEGNTSTGFYLKTSNTIGVAGNVVLEDYRNYFAGNIFLGSSAVDQIYSPGSNYIYINSNSRKGNVFIDSYNTYISDNAYLRGNVIQDNGSARVYFYGNLFLNGSGVGGPSLYLDNAGNTAIYGNGSTKEITIGVINNDGTINLYSNNIVTTGNISLPKNRSINLNVEATHRLFASGGSLYFENSTTTFNLSQAAAGAGVVSINGKTGTVTLYTDNVLTTSANLFVTTGTQTFTGIKYFEDSVVLDGQGDAPGGSKLYLTTNSVNQISANSSPTSPDGNVIYIDANGSKGQIQLNAANTATTGNVLISNNRFINLNTSAVHHLYATGGALFFKNSTDTFNITQAISGAGVTSINGKTGTVTLYTDNVLTTSSNSFLTTGTQTLYGLKYFDDNVVLDGQGDAPGGSKLYLTTNAANQISANSSPTSPDGNVIYVDANGSKGQIQLNAANTATTGNVLLASNRFLNLNTSAMHHLFASGGRLYFQNTTNTLDLTGLQGGGGGGGSGTITQVSDVTTGVVSNARLAAGIASTDISNLTVSGNIISGNVLVTGQIRTGTTIIGETIYANSTVALNKSGGATINFVDDLGDTSDTSIGYNNAIDSLVFNVNGNSILTLTATNSSNSAAVASRLIPSSNNVYDLGAGDYRWKDLYLSGSTIYLGSAQISSPSAGIINLPAGSTINGSAIGTSSGAVSLSAGSGLTATPNTITSTGSFAVNDSVVRTSNTSYVLTSGTQTIGGIKYFEDSVVLDGQGDAPGGSKLYLTTNAANQISANSSPTAPDGNVIYIDANASRGQIQLNAANVATTGNIIITDNRLINLNNVSTHHLFASGGRLYFQNSTSTLDITGLQGGGGSGDITSVTAGDGLSGGASSGDATLQVDASVVRTSNTSYVLTTGSQTITGSKNFTGGLYATGIVVNNSGTGATINFTDDLNANTDTSIYYLNSSDAMVVSVNGTNMLEMVKSASATSIAAGAGISPINDNTEYLGIPTNRWKYFYLSDTAYIGGASLASANISNWNNAYTDRLKWDGGSTGLTAATGRTSLGATGVGANVFTLTNPSAVTFLRVNADNSVSALDASTFRSAIGAGTSSTDTNTTYTLSAETAASGANLRITGSDSSVDNVNFVGSGAVTITRTDANTITIDGTSGGGGDITSVTAGTGLTGGATSGDATLSANTSYLVTIGTNQTITAAKTFTSPIVSQAGMWINTAANTTYPTGTLGDVGDNVSLAVKTPGTTSYKALTLSGGTGVLAVPGNIYFTDVKITFGGPSKDLIGKSDGIYYDGTKLGSGDVSTTGTQTINGVKTFEDGLVTDGVTLRYGNNLFLPPSSGTVSNNNRIYNDGTNLRFVSNGTEKTANWDTAYGWGNHAAAGYGYSNFDGNYNSLSNLPTIPTNTNQLTNGAGYVTTSGARSALSFTAGSGGYNSTSGVITIPTNTNQLTNGAGFITTAVTSVATGSGLTGGTITGTGTISHADTSTAATLTASSRTYVTGLTFDDFGHVTGYTTGTETVTDTNTTYSAGGGLGLAGTTFSVDSSVIRTTGNQSIAGQKTFTDATVFYQLYQSTTGHIIATGDGALCIYNPSGEALFRVYTNGVQVAGYRLTTYQLRVQDDAQYDALAGTGNRAVYSTSGGSLTNSSSDLSLKTNIEELLYGINAVKQLNPVSFNWKDTEKLGAQKEIGFIAQDVQQVVPEVVGTNSDSTLSLDYPKMVAVLTKAVQEQQTLIDRLEARIAALENK
jgi:hypothetical protein